MKNLVPILFLSILSSSLLGGDTLSVMRLRGRVPASIGYEDQKINKGDKSKKNKKFVLNVKSEKYTILKKQKNKNYQIIEITFH